MNVALLAKVIYVSTPGNGLQTALVGLAGVIVGGAITGGFTYWLDRRREHMAVSQAARLIDADLLIAEASARTCVEKKKWWPVGIRLTSEGWDQHRDVIASRLSSDAWLKVMVAVMAVAHLQGHRDATFKIQLAKMESDPTTTDHVAAAKALGLDEIIADPSPTISDSTVTLIAPVLRDLTTGRAALAPLTRD